jgi:hypothetical protein
MVNRIWAWHFGRGIVTNPNNLGKMGRSQHTPSCSTDWRIISLHINWSVKEMHRCFAPVSNPVCGSTFNYRNLLD